MALTTQCPHCGAAFKVVADQLRIRDGLVRCGVCAAVFDGRAHLQEEAPVREATSAPNAAVDFREAPMVMRTRADYPPPADDDTQFPDAEHSHYRRSEARHYRRSEARHYPVRDERDASEQDQNAPPDEAVPDYTYLGHREDVVYGADGVAAYHDDGPVSSSGRGPATYGEDGVVAYRAARTEDQDHGQYEAQDDARYDAGYDAGYDARYETGYDAQSDAKSDVQSDVQRDSYAPIFGEVRSNRAYREPRLRDSNEADLDGAIRGEPRTRYVDDPHSGRAPPEFMDEGITQRQQSSAFGWGLGCLMLVLVLLGLSTYVYRTQIATAVPALRPALELGCKALGCTVGYERRIERISIASSSLTPPQGIVAQEGDRQNLVLQMVLRNRFNAPQPWPAISVELNDLSDTVVLRKTILPADYLPAAMRSQPFGPNAEQRIRLPLTVVGVQVNGYQLDKFFP